MTYNEAEKLVSEHQYLIGKKIISPDNIELNFPIIVLLIAPSIKEMDKVFNNWWYDINHSNSAAIFQLGKQYYSFEVFVIAYNNGDIIHGEINKYLKIIKS